MICADMIIDKSSMEVRMRGQIVHCTTLGVVQQSNQHGSANPLFPVRNRIVVLE